MGVLIAGASAWGVASGGRASDRSECALDRLEAALGSIYGLHRGERRWERYRQRGKTPLPAGILPRTSLLEGSYPGLSFADGLG